MTIWAIADPHLSFGVANKSMSIYGPKWADHPEKMRQKWLATVAPEDLVLIAGDISWAMKAEEARADLEWIAALPGTKLLLRGNHDYWWPSMKQMKDLLPSSVHAIHNNAFDWGDATIGGSRLWDCDQFHFGPYIDFRASAKVAAAVTEAEALAKDTKYLDEQRKIYARELQRLEMSLQALNPKAAKRIAMVHYPPVSADLQDSPVSALLEKYHIQACVFGHLHALKPGQSLFGTKNGVRYLLTACDSIDFTPIKVFSPEAGQGKPAENRPCNT